MIRNKKFTTISISLFIFAVLISVVTANLGLTAGALLLVGLVAIPSVFFIVKYPRIGIVVLLVLSYFIMWFIRMNLIEFPLGTIMDVMQVLLLIGFFIKQKYYPNWRVLKDPIAIMVLIWVGYNLLQVANPTAESRLAWVYTVRSTAVVMLMYFVFNYNLRDVKFIRLILKLWIALTVFAALYAIKQEYFGFFTFEENYLNSDPRLRYLLFINGHWRKFSIFSDPIAFSYNMVFCSIFCITMLFNKITSLKKIILSICVMLFLTTMLYSGTRGAYILIPAAIVLFAIMNFNKQVLIFTIVGSLFLALLIVLPSSSPSIRRFQSAFTPSDDASFKLRKANQKKIQPYIQTHPFGGGLGATGQWGVRFSPNSFLASFPPDSGYVRTAVELGWVGLLLFCMLMFVILKVGINNYYQIRDPELKSYCLAMTLIVFAYAIGNYPQEALVQFPSNIYFYLFAALINVTLKLDQQNKPLESDLTILK